jgi:hypothetical protein
MVSCFRDLRRSAALSTLWYWLIHFNRFKDIRSEQLIFNDIPDSSLRRHVYPWL